MSTLKPELRHLPIEFITPNPKQPRQHFDPDKLNELAEAIRSTDGLLQPIMVREIPQSNTDSSSSNHYEIIAGERRWRACQVAGLDTIDCLIRNCSDEEMLEASIIENVSRADLNPIEEAKAYQRMIDEFGYVHDEIAAAIGKPRPNISNSLRLLNLDAKVQKRLIDESLSAGHGKLLAALPSQTQRKLAEICIKKRLSVRQLELLIKQRTNMQQSAEELPDPNLQALENTISDQMGCKVNLNFDKSSQRGQLIIHFHSLDVFSGLLKKIGIKT